MNLRVSIPFVMVVGKTFKKKGKRKFNPKKKPFGPTGRVTKPKHKKVNVNQVDVQCFYCKEKGHWKRNCKKYLDSLKKQGKILTKNVFMISLTITDPTIWVLDTGSSFNICNTLQGLRITKRLNKGEMNLQVREWSKCCCCSRRISLINNVHWQSASVR